MQDVAKRFAEFCASPAGTEGSTPAPGMLAGRTGSRQKKEMERTFATATDVPGGTIRGCPTWTVAGSPHVVQGKVTVQSGGSLTIEPGVEVRFASNYNISIGGTSAGSAGALTAIGTPGSPITFRTDGTSAVGTWQYLRFQAGATAGHCVVLSRRSVAQRSRARSNSPTATCRSRRGSSRPRRSSGGPYRPQAVADTGTEMECFGKESP